MLQSGTLQISGEPRRGIQLGAQQFQIADCVIELDANALALRLGAILDRRVKEGEQIGLVRPIGNLARKRVDARAHVGRARRAAQSPHCNLVRIRAREALGERSRLHAGERRLEQKQAAIAAQYNTNVVPL